MSVMSREKSNVKVIKMGNYSHKLEAVKILENLDFLEGSWPELEEIRLQNKNITQFKSLMEVEAPELKTLNFSENRIANLDSFKGIYFPHLTYLNLGIVLVHHSLQQVEKPVRSSGNQSPKSQAPECEEQFFLFD